MISVTANLTAEKFLEQAGPWLEQEEARNNLILGIAANIASKPPDQRQEHYFWVVKQDKQVAGAAFWTPPYKLSLTLMEPEALAALARKVQKTFPELPGISGPQELLPAFIRAWHAPGLQAELQMSNRLYQLDKVETVPSRPGQIRPASLDKKELLVHWCKQFHTEIHTPDPVDEKVIVEGYLKEKRLFVWEEGGGIQAMAGCSGLTAHGARVNMVYTPPGLRKRGYATSLVAALSQRLLDSGKKFCVLYTDLLNPTSNSIYQKIGYRPVCDWDNYSFQKFKSLF